MWIQQIILGIVGVSGGVFVSGGLFAFIIGLGIVSDLADRTHTGSAVVLYERAVALGALFGNLFYIFEWRVWNFSGLLAFYGLFAGIFMGCWIMAIAEVLKVFPIFIRKIQLHKILTYMIISVAIGKGLGALFYFWKGW